MAGTLEHPLVQQGDARLCTLPKAHLHLHLEHSIRPATLAEFAARNGVVLHSFYTFTNLPEFLARGSVLRACITSPDDFRRICWEMVEDAARDGVLYLEPMAVLHRWVPRFGSLEEVFHLIREAFDEAQTAFGIEVGLMVGFSRHRDSLEEIEQLARFAAAHAGDGVVAFGFGGDEAAIGPQPFAPACTLARQAGLLIVPHAGETAGAESVAAAIQTVSPARIAHGVRAVEDPEVLTLLRERSITCDICPTSNLRLGVVSHIEAHPINQMIQSGVPITLNVDDPLEFWVTVSSEYALIRDTFHLSDTHMAQIATTSALASGASTHTKSRLLQGIQQWLESASTSQQTLKS